MSAEKKPDPQLTEGEAYKNGLHQKVASPELLTTLQNQLSGWGITSVKLPNAGTVLPQPTSVQYFEDKNGLPAPACYTVARLTEHQKIIDAYINGDDDAITPVEHPVAIAVMGPPGAGKMTFLDLVRGNSENYIQSFAAILEQMKAGNISVPRDELRGGAITNTVYLNTHIIMAVLPEFKEYQEAYGDLVATALLAEESRHIADKIMLTAIETKRSFIRDTSLTALDSPESVFVFSRLDQRGYETHIINLTVSPEEALHRIQERESTLPHGGVVDPSDILEKARSSAADLQQATQLAQRVYVFDANNRDVPGFEMIAYAEKGKAITKLDAVKYTIFEKNTSVNPNARNPDEVFSRVRVASASHDLTF